MKRQDTKICIVCQRPMTWRKKWAKTWDEVKYCSDACRRNKAGKAEAAKGLAGHVTSKPGQR